MLEGSTTAIVPLLENNAPDSAGVVFIALLNPGDSVRVSERSRGKITTSRCIAGAHSAQVCCKMFFFFSAISLKHSY